MATSTGSPTRTASVSSERTSVAGLAMQPVPTASAKPLPAYVAASAASQIVTDIYDSDQSLDQDGQLVQQMTQGAYFSEEALTLVNTFLDYLLYCILGSARDTALDAIRNAIFDVLKQKLAREATTDADHELANLMGDDDDDSTDGNDRSATPWELDRIWKRTRLRIMVYTRLGEMDDDEELEYLDYEEDAADLGLVPPAAAIYLTSVMESIAEKTIRSAGYLALARVIKESRREDFNQHRVIVEERDAEKIALDPTLGRLWRIWKRNLKTPPSRLVETPRGSRSPYATRFGTSHHGKRGSVDTLNGSVASGQEHRRYSIPDVIEIPDDEVSETDIAANIPLPISDDDIAEIQGSLTAAELAEILLAGGNNRGRPLSMSWPVLQYTDNDRALIRRARSFSNEQAGEEANFASIRRAMDHATSNAAASLAEIIREWKEGIFTYDAGDSATSIDESEGEGEADSIAEPENEEKREFEDEEDDHDTDTVYSAADDADNVQVVNVTRMSMQTPPAPPEVVHTVISTPSPSLRELESRSRGSSDGFMTPQDSPRNEKSGASSNTQGARGTSVAKIAGLGLIEPVLADRHLSVDDGGDAHTSREIGLARTSDVPITNGNEHIQTSALLPTTALAEDSQSITQTKLSSAPSAAAPYVKEPATEDENASKSAQAPGSHNLTTLKEDEPSDATLVQGAEPTVTATNRPAEADRTTYVIGQPLTIMTEARSVAPAASPAAEKERPQLPPKDVPSGRDRSSSKPSLHSLSEQRPPSSGYVMLRRSGSTTHTSSAFDTSPVQFSRGFDPKESIEDRERKFDDLIKNEETVKYTLTPQTMRDLDVSSLPPSSPSTKSRKLSFGGSIHSDRGQPKVTSGITNPAKPAMSQITGPSSPITENPTLKATVPRSQVMNTKPTKKGMMAREPQARHETMFDMADYLRTTAPPRANDPVVPDVIRTRHAQRAVSTPQTQVAIIPSAQPKMRLQPRPAVLAPPTTNDLVTLIREGPPGTSSRSDKPDSFNSAIGSAQSTSGPSTSRTNLLPSQGYAQNTSSTPQRAQQFSSPNDRPAPTRTQRRIKDPYAISDDEEDDDDDDLDLLTALPKKNIRKEESLVEFLNRVEPPVNNGPTMITPSSAALSRLGGANGRSSPASNTQGTMLKSKITIIPNTPATTLRSKPVARSAGAANDRTIRLESYRGNLDIADFLRSTGPDDAAAAAPVPFVGVSKDGNVKKGRRFWKR